MQALYSDRHRNLHDGYGLKYETAAGHPSLNVGYMPWRGAREHYRLMQAMSHTCVFGILLRDRDGGEVRIDGDGEPVVRYRLSDYDRRHLRVGIEGAAEMLQLGSFHLMGSARMGGSPATSACDPNAQTWDVRDLYVLDGSAFPTSSGVNPQISIQAIAHMGARALAARLT
jgi:choline dehydrogenase-like flavoprotein